MLSLKQSIMICCYLLLSLRGMAYQLYESRSQQIKEKLQKNNKSWKSKKVTEI